MTSAYRTKKQIEEAFEAVKKHWTDKVNVDFSTGDTNIDNYLKWICFQPVLRRIYGCSFLPYMIMAKEDVAGEISGRTVLLC